MLSLAIVVAGALTPYPSNETIAGGPVVYPDATANVHLLYRSGPYQGYAGISPGDLMGPGDFQVVARAPSVGQLSDTLTGDIVSSSTITPTWSYRGADANATNWVPRVGSETLTAQGGDGVFGAPSPMVEDAVDLEDNRYYDGLTWDPAGNDVIVEIIARGNDTGDGTFLDCQNSGTTDQLRLYWDTTVNDGPEYAADDGTLSDTLVTTWGNSGAWLHMLYMFNKDSNAFISVNGEGDFNNKAWGVTGSIDINTDCSIGADNDASNNLEFELLEITAWECSGCLTSDVNVARDFANLRHSRLVGLEFESAAGATADFFTVRSSEATQMDDDGSRRMFNMSKDWARVELPPNETEYGVLSERAVTNELTATDNMTSDWTCTGCTINGLNTDGPYGPSTMNPINYNGAGTNCIVEQQEQVLNTSGTTFYCHVKDGPGSADWVAIRPDSSTSRTAFFDLSSVGTQGCPVGTVGVSVDDTWSWPFDDDGDGTDDGCLVGVTYTPTNTLTNQQVIVAEGDNDITFAAPTNAVELYVGQCQIAPTFAPGSFIQTLAGTQVTRNVDRVYHQGNNSYSISGSSTLWTRSFWPDAVNITSQTRLIAEVHDSSAGAGDDINVLLHSSNQWRAQANTTGNTGLVAEASATDDINGTWMNIATTLELNSMKLYIDGVEIGTEDTDVGVLGGNLENFTLGSNDTPASNHCGWVSQARYWVSVEEIAE